MPLADQSIWSDGTPYYSADTPPHFGTYTLPPGARLVTQAELDTNAKDYSAAGIYKTSTNDDVAVYYIEPKVNTASASTESATTNKTSLLNAVASSSGRLGSDLPAVEGPPVVNPLHKFASYTYNWSFWWLSLDDYAKLRAFKDVDKALTWFPAIGGGSYVLAEDSGIYPDRRVPNTFGINYNIEDVTFTSLIGHNKTSKSANLITGKMTVVEPLGCTFIDSMVQAGFDQKKQQFTNYTQQPYMLQLDFVGYDDYGQPLPAKDLALYRKRFPITLTKVDVAVDGKGSKYTMSYVPIGSKAFSREMGHNEADINIEAGTINEFFNGPKGLAAQLTAQHLLLAAKGEADYGNIVKFDIDPLIAQSKIVDERKAIFTEVAPDAEKLSFGKKMWSIPPKTNILDIITRMMAQSDFLINRQAFASDELKGTQANQLDAAQILRLFKTTSTIKYRGQSKKTGTIVDNVWDETKFDLPIEVTYHIGQYLMLGSEHPDLNNKFTDTVPYTAKKYNYLYTGQNVDVINFNLNFNTTYYTALMGFPTNRAGFDSGPDKTRDQKQALLPIQRASIRSYGSAIAQLNTIPNVQPSRISSGYGNQSETVATGGRPEAIKVMNILNSVMNPVGADNIALELHIVGDPTLLKQDDWLYTASPTESPNYYSADSQYIFANKFGHIRMDHGEVIVTVTVNSPIDYDMDLQGIPGQDMGLMIPRAGTYQTLFSGQYRILSINNTFAQGKFEQKLSLVRYATSSLVAAFSNNNDAVRQNIANAAKNGVNTNGYNVGIPVTGQPGVFTNPEDNSTYRAP